MCIKRSKKTHPWLHSTGALVLTEWEREKQPVYQTFPRLSWVQYAVLASDRIVIAPIVYIGLLHNCDETSRYL